MVCGKRADRQQVAPILADALPAVSHATLAGRVGALEAQASECFEDRKVLRQELAAIRDRK